MSRGNRRSKRSPGSRLQRGLAIGLCSLALVACRPPQQMADQPQYDPYEQSAFFEDGMSARQLVPGTVARGTLKSNDFLHTGMIDGQPANAFPFPVTKDVLMRGHERYDIYCSPCHSRVGDGRGMIVLRGYRNPPSFHTETLRARPVGHFFDVMTNGFGAMPAYGTMIPVRDRWAIAAYIRALQLSQNATLAQVPSEALPRLESEGGGR